MAVPGTVLPPSASLSCAFGTIRRIELKHTSGQAGPPTLGSVLDPLPIRLSSPERA